MIALSILAYVVPGVMVGLLVWDVLDVSDDEKAPAIGFLAGLFWPATVACGLAWGLFTFSRAIVRSFAALLSKEGA